MKKLILFTLLILLKISLSAQQVIPTQTDQIIIRFTSDFGPVSLNTEKLITGDSEIDRILSESKAMSMTKLNTGRNSDFTAVVVKFPPDKTIRNILDELVKAAAVEFAEPDFIGYGSGVKGVSPNDTYYYRQWGLKNDGSFPDYPAKAGADIEMEEGWAIEQGDSTIVAGIIDSGCKLNHPELQNRIWKNYIEIPGNGIDEDNNNYIDDIQGWDFANSDNNPTDDMGHGTNVTGIIGANGNNNLGYAGVDWNCKLMILKGINSQNWGYYSWWSDAIHYAVDNGANVLNMSVGGTDASTLLQDAVNYALDHNVTVVACMMNTNSNTVFYPAAYPGVIAVGATNPDDTRSHPFFWSNTSGSNYGAHISVVAPGNYIYGLDYLSNNQYGTYWGGTSQATPLVTGLAAMILAQNPLMTPDAIKQLIQSTAEDQVGDLVEDTPGWDQYYGFGRINAYHALLLVSGINENEKPPLNFIVYPNPNQGIINIRLTKTPVNKTQIAINNSLGQLVYKDELKDQESSIHLLRVPGIYCITITSGNSECSTKFIIR